MSRPALNLRCMSFRCAFPLRRLAAGRRNVETSKLAFPAPIAGGQREPEQNGYRVLPYVAKEHVQLQQRGEMKGGHQCVIDPVKKMEEKKERQLPGLRTSSYCFAGASRPWGQGGVNLETKKRNSHQGPFCSMRGPLRNCMACRSWRSLASGDEHDLRLCRSNGIFQRES